jgi:hypothetical protein
VPLFLAFLRHVPIGIVAWSLQPGALVKGAPGLDTVHDGNDFRFTTNPYDLATPSVLRPDYRCNAASLGEGVGALIQDYFAKYSERSSAALFPTFG